MSPDVLRLQTHEWLVQRVRQLQTQLVSKERDLQDSRAAQRRTHRELKGLRQQVTECEQSLLALRQVLTEVWA
jgi:predicted  nucleic acid-binding Zn-ribbon protein